MEDSTDFPPLTLLTSLSFQLLRLLVGVVVLRLVPLPPISRVFVVPFTPFIVSFCQSMADWRKTIADSDRQVSTRGGDKGRVGHLEAAALDSKMSPGWR